MIFATCGLVLMQLAVHAAASASSSSFSGTWTDAPPAGFGGELFICEDSSTGIAQGFYSETGYARGVVTEVGGVRAWAGQWYEPGGADDRNNWGDFVVQLSDDGQSFNGSWSYNSAPAEIFVWDAMLLSDEQPESKECLALNAQGLFAEIKNEAAKDGYSLAGSWLANETYEWHICVSGGRFRSSYVYDADGVATRGFISGEVKHDGQVLMGQYWEEGDLEGIFLLGQSSNREMISSYWEVPSVDEIDISQINDFDMHAVEYTRRISTAVTDEQCDKNYYLSVGGSPGSGNNDDDDDYNTPSDTVIALSVVLAVLCAAVVAGGGFYVFSNDQRRRKQARRNSRASS